MRQISIMAHLPELFDSIREFKRISTIEDIEFKELLRCNEQDLVDAFVLTASEKSITIWEREIGIRADFLNDTLEFRRKRLINRYTIKPPFTIRWLENQLRTFLGAGFIKAERDDDVEILYVYADLSSLPELREFDTTIETVLPLSMQYFKILTAHLEMVGCFYVGSEIQTHLHFEIHPAGEG